MAGPIRQLEGRHGRTNGRLAEGDHQRGQPAGAGEGVRVQKDERVGCCGGRTGVAAGPEALVGGPDDQLHLGKAGHHVAGAVV